VLVITTVPVFGNDKGSINISASGGIPPYRYSIDNGVTLQKSGEFGGLDAGIYTVYVVDSVGCFKTAQVNLNVELFDVDVTVHDVSCHGLADGSFYLAMVDGTGPFTLTGSFTDTLIIESGAFSFTGQTAGAYDVKIEDSKGRIFMDTIVISEPEGIDVTASITDAHCWNTEDGAIDITVTGGSSNYLFSWDDGASTEDRNSIMAGNYRVRITDDKDCSYGYNFTVMGLNPSPFVYAGRDTVKCAGSIFQLQGNDGESVFWQTDTPGVVFIDDNTIPEPRVTIEQTTVFEYLIIKDGCINSDSVEIVVPELPELRILIVDDNMNFEDDTIAYLIEGETIPLMAYFEKPVYNLQWYPPTGITDPTGELVDITPVESDYYKVIGMSSLGCPVSDSIQLIVARVLNIYNSFSPNGDGVNDTWVINHAFEYGDRINVKVFNRWGEPIFESKGYGGSNEWDGNRNGKMIPVGSYYYIITINDGKSKPYTGTVTILR
jgi:gliding motility-associated-like protein